MSGSHSYQVGGCCGPAVAAWMNRTGWVLKHCELKKFTRHQHNWEVNIMWREVGSCHQQGKEGKHGLHSFTAVPLLIYTWSKSNFLHIASSN